MEKNIYFKDVRFSLSSFGELLVRVVVYSFYTVLSVVAFTLFFSDVENLFWLSVLLLIFLFDRVIQAKKGNVAVSELLRRKNANVALCFTPTAYRIFHTAYRRSLITGSDPRLVLLDALLGRKDIRKMLSRLDIDAKEFSAKLIEKTSESGGGKPDKKACMEEFENMAIGAFWNAESVYEQFIEPRNLFAAVSAGDDPVVTRLFNLFDLNPADLAEVIVFNRYSRKFSNFRHVPAFLGDLVFRREPVRRRAINRAWTSRPTKLLDEFSIDLTDLARTKKSGFLVGHKKEYDDILRIISRPGKPNVLLVGDPGVGMSSIIAHLAYEMTKDNVPDVLFDKRLISLDITRLVANATPETLSGRIRDMIEEVVAAGNVVLFIENMHDLFRTADAKSINAIDLFLPVIVNERIPVIGTTYPREFKTHIESRTDFLDRFDVVRVDEISEQEAVRFLVFRTILLEREFDVFVTFGAIRKSVELAHKYFRNRPLPGSASDLLKEAIAHANQQKEKTVSPEIIVRIAEAQSRIPIKRAEGEEAEKLLDLENIIHKRLVNQENAVSAVSRALREYRSGLSRKGGPIASFLFVGPTGVGKTELSKILSSIQFGSKEMMQRFDMSEYQDKQSIFRFIGTPDGSKTGSLTDGVLAKPYSLILLDEFEKAHPDILNLFLQVFDDGRLTDSLGRTVSFENTIIIATSNAHSDLIKKRIEEGAAMTDINEEIKKKLTDYFRPELLNRFSNIVAFRSLTKEEIGIIAGFLVAEVAETLEEAHGITLHVDKEALFRLAELGYSPVFGARPLRQVISEKIRSVLAEKLLRKEIARGNSVRAILDGDEIRLSVES